jgi:1,4-dihydroxy-2-naphthoate polyprenyltransferase
MTTTQPTADNSGSGPARNLNKWVAGARPRTLPAAIAPVLVGTSLIRTTSHSLNFTNAFLALGVSLLLQIAVNYSNDYSDGIRGTDEVRVGPVRLVASGLATPAAVKRAAFMTFALAGVLGVILASRTSWWLVLVGAIAIVAAWGYTGGKSPYGYKGFGEISVFIFFGVVATVGSYYAQAERVDWQSILISIPMGALSCAILSINNLRDLPKDALVGKKTLAVRLGDQRARWMFVGLLLLAHVSAACAAFITPRAFITIALIPQSYMASFAVLRGAKGRDLIPLLGRVGKIQLYFAIGLAAAFLIKG